MRFLLLHCWVFAGLLDLFHLGDMLSGVQIEGVFPQCLFEILEVSFPRLEVDA